jgi:hypothetical protein
MRHVVMYGNPAIGFSLVGPFDTVDEANEWADDNATREYDWWILPIAEPTQGE